jgi:SWIM zinc finger
MATELGYSYLAPSSLSTGNHGADLALATSGGRTRTADSAVETAHPFFFSGFVEHPQVVAQALLVVAKVARSRFFIPPGVIARRALDPVVTSTPEGLRFESFSQCCGVYARLDVDGTALDAAHVASGVTNVDVNPPLRHALAGLRTGEPLRLQVGSEELRVATLDGELVEEKVPLPSRWLKGFAETQVLTAQMTVLHTLDAPSTRTFVQSLPVRSATKAVSWVTRTARSLRLASRPSTGAVCVSGPERLRVIEPLLRFATGMQAYGPLVTATSLPVASAWVIGLPGARVTIALSPEKARGFSGEGAVLDALAGEGNLDDVDLVTTVLSFEPRIDEAHLAAQTGLPTERVRTALGILASSGQVGYDLTTGTFFHRPLPVRADLLDRLHPRLAGATRLVEAGAARELGDGVTRVVSGDVFYDVRLVPDGEDRCSCSWFVKYRGTRGPCKHVLAARLLTHSPKGDER